MHKKFNHKEIERKWQEKWAEWGIYNIGERDQAHEKEYVLVEWPYPSGNLHIGHWYAFAVPDIYVRAHRMQGKQVLYPIGFDAFGLPAENAALKHNTDPKNWTDSNIAHMREQFARMGNAFSWNRAVSATDETYYRWTQWMFTKFFEKGIAYRGSGVVNWCPSCNTVLANEQVLRDNTCERCGTLVEKKKMEEWKLRITQYADRLVDDLQNLDWSESIKEAQRQWIGRRRGAELTFKLSTGDAFNIFTTRPDTLFGVTYVVFAPEHELVAKNKDKIENWDEVETYIKTAKKRAGQDRLDETREKTGIELKGLSAINPANGEGIPVYVADYVLESYGTGAIMGVPAHDERDYDFAKNFSLPIKKVLEPLFTKSEGADAFKVSKSAEYREAVCVVVRNPKDNTYLGLKWKNHPIKALITGGVTEGEDISEAAQREVLEETGYKNLKLVRKTDFAIHSKFWHQVKKVNRHARFTYVFFDLEDEEQVEVAESEKALHEVVWVPERELKGFFNVVEGDFLPVLLSDFAYVHTGEGVLINSGEFDGLETEEARDAIIRKVGGAETHTYRLRDWSIGRQRYWGVPIPIVYDPEGKPHVVPEEHLPWTLPTDVDFKPTGQPPLAKSQELKERTERIFGEGWTPEVETMDTFVDSSWYYLRYLDPENKTALSSLSAQKEWMPIDIYFGGPEHTTMHLLYSRFWQKALFDLKLVTVDEPYTKRVNRGLVLGPDGNKMSKSKGNIVDPDEQVEAVGADAVKMYLAFMGPYGEVANYPWDLSGIVGQRRFLERVYGLDAHITETEPEEIVKHLHKTIKKVTEDIERYKFNTAISALMIFLNAAEKQGITEKTYRTFLLLLAPFAPHLTEELWAPGEDTGSIHKAGWPAYDQSLIVEKTTTVSVQINGKMRGTIEIEYGADEKTVLEALRSSTQLAEKVPEKITRVVYVPDRVINLIAKEGSKIT